MKVTWHHFPCVFNVFKLKKCSLTVRHSAWKTWCCFVFAQQSLSSFRVWSSLLTAPKGAQGALQYSQGTLTENEPQGQKTGLWKENGARGLASSASEWERRTGLKLRLLALSLNPSRGKKRVKPRTIDIPFMSVSVCVPEGMSGLSRHTSSPWRRCINTREFADSQQQQTRAEPFSVSVVWLIYFFPQNK